MPTGLCTSVFYNKECGRAVATDNLDSVPLRRVFNP